MKTCIYVIIIIRIVHMVHKNNKATTNYKQSRHYKVQTTSNKNSKIKKIYVLLLLILSSENKLLFINI